MFDKKFTRKEFLVSIASIAGLFVMSKIPTVTKNSIMPKRDNAYGNYSYGGGKKNA